MSLYDYVTVALLIYLLPIIVAVAGLVIMSSIIWIDVQFGHSKLLISSDIGRKFELQQGTERFRSLEGRLSYAYVLWAFGNSGVQAAALYRVSSFFLRHGWHLLADFVRRCALGLTGIDISPYATIGRGLVIHHGQGIVIGKNTRIGENVTLYHDVTTGSGRPQLEDEVVVWPGARIIGNVTVGRRSEVGANAVVLDDVPEESVAVGVPASCSPTKKQPQTAVTPGFEEDSFVEKSAADSNS